MKGGRTVRAAAKAVRLARTVVQAVATPFTTAGQLALRLARRHPWIIGVAVVPLVLSAALAGTATLLVVQSAGEMMNVAATFTGMAGTAVGGSGGSGAVGPPLPGGPAPGQGGYTGPKGSTAPYTEPNLPAVTSRMLQAVVPIFGRGRGIGCWGEREGPTDHDDGHACDFMMATTGTMPNAEWTAHGWAMANYLIANAGTLRVKYIIWQEQIWQNGQWRRYTRYGPGGGITQNHYDHVHLSLYTS